MLRVLQILEQYDPEHSPNTLSSDVIGCVVPRAPTTSESIYTEAVKTVHHANSATHNSSEVEDTNTLSRTRSGRADHTKWSTEQDSPKLHTKYRIKSSEEYRERRRLRQERFRAKQAQREKDLKTEVKKLRQDVPLLEMQRLRMSFENGLTLGSVVTEYFQIFRRGIWPSNAATSCFIKAMSQQQLVFLQTAISRHVIVGKFQGVDALIEQWRRYCTYFDNVEFRLGELEFSSPNIVWTRSTMSVSITEKTLEKVFPHLLEAEQLRLRSKLLSQRLVLPCRVCFEWNEVSKRVVRLDTMVDFITPLLDVLGNLDSVALALKKFLIISDCFH
ncbi:hypothetical protein F443_16219 [Phytophthora nicotianae P1569]|uniref:BZIP domain-containing protein n=1 Tax=Phytophthora nicotianae P1569 TaxID=1317065 RepID=V9EIQ7_PHYNI|nr:hypothetical protein F443_16219 [Phytophthora nicotianae P1569]